MNKKIFFIALSLIIASAAFAQKPVIEFEKKVHDFARFKEEDGKVLYEFKFTNKGDSPLVINRVTASCGCTTPNWSKEPIMPGKTGKIVAEYNPLGRPGVFSKSITVYSNAADAQVNLLIKGDVIPKGSSAK